MEEWWEVRIWLSYIFIFFDGEFFLGEIDKILFKVREKMRSEVRGEERRVDVREN